MAMFKPGVYTAIITPFQSTGLGIDEAAYRKLIERQIEAAVTGLVIAGSTGEGQTLEESEWNSVLQIALSYKNQIQIVGACGSSSTAQTALKFKKLADLGVHAALISTPAYNKPPQRGLIRHFEEIAKAAPHLPIMVYNIPGRTSINLLPSTLQEIWKLENVIAIKESSGNWDQIIQTFSELPSGKSLFSGDDPFNLPVFAMGGHGTVSVLSNVAPKALVALWTTVREGSISRAQEVQRAIAGFIPLLFSESNPIPTKWCMSQILGQELPPRLPLVALDSAHHAKLRDGLEKLKKFGFI